MHSLHIIPISVYIIVTCNSIILQIASTLNRVGDCVAFLSSMFQSTHLIPINRCIWDIVLIKLGPRWHLEVQYDQPLCRHEIL